MTNPHLQPGYVFQRLRVLKSAFEAKEDAAQTTPELGIDLHLDESVGYADGMVRYIQSVHVHAFPPGRVGPWLVRAEITMEAIFSYPPGSKPNIPPEEFVANAATAIVFPFAREWIYRRTSQAGSVSPILLPPINLIALRGDRKPKDVGITPKDLSGFVADRPSFFAPPVKKRQKT
jgi:preprotein translocase subunit SecB